MTVAPTTGAMRLDEVRARAREVLAPVLPDDPEVVDLSDAVVPPVLMLDWDDPWLTFQTGCMYWAQLSILCIAGRIEPLPGVEEIERLAVYTLTRFKADSYPWPLVASQANRVLRVGNLPYFGARLTYRVPVSLT